VPIGGDLGGSIVKGTINTLAQAGMWIVPVAFLLVSMLSVLRQRKRNDLMQKATGPSAAAMVAKMTWSDFEILVGEGFRRRGYRAIETGGAGADGGVDLVLVKGNETTLVQCKHWKSTKVGVSVVRELFGIMAAQGASCAYVVTSGAFTSDALKFANGRNIDCINGEALLRLLDRADKPTQPATAGVSNRAERGTDGVGSSVGPPSCPDCAKPMVRRVARRGSTKSREFWGCPAFVDGCRGTRAA
jgi:restriction system protein